MSRYQMRTRDTMGYDCWMEDGQLRWKRFPDEPSTYDRRDWTPPARKAPRQINMHNRKPFRTKAQKQLARATAYKDKDGAWRSTAPISIR